MKAWIALISAVALAQSAAAGTERAPYLLSQPAGILAEGGGRARLALPLPTSPLAVAPDGSVYYGHGLEIGRLAARARTADVLVSDVNFPHGIALDGRGGLVVSDTGNGRVVRIDLETRGETVVAARLRDPMGLVLEPAGTAVAIEFRTGRLLRVGRGSAATVARGLRRPYALTRRSAGRFYVAGDLVRATGRIARVDPGGRVVRLRLRPR